MLAKVETYYIRIATVIVIRAQQFIIYMSTRSNVSHVSCAKVQISRGEEELGTRASLGSGDSQAFGDHQFSRDARWVLRTTVAFLRPNL